MFNFSSIFVAIIHFFSVWRSEPLVVLNLAFRVSISYRHPKSSPFSFGVQSRYSFFVWHSEPHLRFGVQSHYIIHFGVQSHHSSLVRHSELHCHLGIQSHIVILAFRVVSSVWHSEPLFVFSSISRVVFRLAFSVGLVFRATFSFLTSRVIAFLVWRSEPLVIFRLAFRATCSFWRSKSLFIFCLAYRAVFSSWCSESYLQFGVQSHTFSLMFKVDVFYLVLRATFSVWHSESSCLSFVRHSDPLPFPSFFFLAFIVIGHTPSSLLSHIFILHFGVQSRFSYPFMHFESFLSFSFGV